MSQYQPSINELLLTVQRFVDESGGALSGEARYHALCASYVLGICERELRLRPGYDVEEQAQLARFLRLPGPREELRDRLCREIRDGVHDAAWDPLLDMLLALSANDVRIVKPEHLAPEHRSP